MDEYDFIPAVTLLLGQPWYNTINYVGSHAKRMNAERAHVNLASDKMSLTLR